MRFPHGVRGESEVGPRPTLATDGPGSPGRHRPGQRDRHEQPEPDPRARRRRLALIAASTVAVAAAGLGMVAGGVFSYDKPQHDKALPDIDTTIPGSSAPNTAPTGKPSAGSTPSNRATSRAPSTTPSASSSASTEPAAPGATTSPSKSPSEKATASGSAAPSTSASRPAESTPPRSDGTLRAGDRGAAVQDLQQRLWQMRLYTGSRDGVFNSEVEQALTRYQIARGISEERGTYGPLTRGVLESETSGGGDGRGGEGGRSGGNDD
ncbi:peptidoglycan-binding protein [Streptomyces sp. NPDC058171]